MSLMSIPENEEREKITKNLWKLYGPEEWNDMMIKNLKFKNCLYDYSILQDCPSDMREK